MALAPRPAEASGGDSGAVGAAARMAWSAPAPHLRHPTAKKARAGSKGQAAADTAGRRGEEWAQAVAKSGVALPAVAAAAADGGCGSVVAAASADGGGGKAAQKTHAGLQPASAAALHPAGAAGVATADGGRLRAPQPPRAVPFVAGGGLRKVSARGGPRGGPAHAGADGDPPAAASGGGTARVGGAVAGARFPSHPRPSSGGIREAPGGVSAEAAKGSGGHVVGAPDNEAHHSGAGATGSARCRPAPAAAAFAGCVPRK